MPSTESIFSQPSQDPLSSNNSYLFNDDETDVFLLEDRDKPYGIHSTQSDFSNRTVYSMNISSVLSLSSSSSSVLGRSSSESEQGKNGRTKGHLLFTRKCLELQGYIRPLLELLNGLKKGRFDKGLSSFQQSIAMDRIQRIVGVLQKPHIG
ncbi:hypothetical protein QQF64_009635, partial [Cirrhinus molitorella]